MVRGENKRLKERKNLKEKENPPHTAEDQHIHHKLEGKVGGRCSHAHDTLYLSFSIFDVRSSSCTHVSHAGLQDAELGFLLQSLLLLNCREREKREAASMS